MSLETLLLLRSCLHGQQLVVGDPSFSGTAKAVLVALEELESEIAKTSD